MRGTGGSVGRIQNDPLLLAVEPLLLADVLDQLVLADVLEPLLLAVEPLLLADVLEPLVLAV